eukprot:TRINITY_DN27733_c0_g1_i2.p1 TRINITY_DN27733_c0_g1~~TRINITY_DN27733_c0_g1_i2.p1  ORF type:complete len:397 (+),score=83.89 TRINITY_DN27733_c0_g1_i2:100-1290(+)
MPPFAVPPGSVLGVDVGGVLSVIDTDTGDHEAMTPQQTRNLSQSVVRRPLAEDAAAALHALVRRFGPAGVFLVSKAGPTMALATLVWLHLNNAYERTGLLRCNVRFCRKRCGNQGRDAELVWAPLRPGDSALRDMAEAAGCTVDAQALVATAAVPAAPGRDQVGKGVVCAALGVTHFIDDRPDCLLSVLGEPHPDVIPAGRPAVRALLLFGGDADRPLPTARQLLAEICTERRARPATPPRSAAQPCAVEDVLARATAAGCDLLRLEAEEAALDKELKDLREADAAQEAFAAAVARRQAWAKGLAEAHKPFLRELRRSRSWAARTEHEQLQELRRREEAQREAAAAARRREELSSAARWCGVQAVGESQWQALLRPVSGWGQVLAALGCSADAPEG